MSRKSENSPFICKNCNRKILAVSNGSYRNHCPYCLCSVHVDIMPGDRLSSCHGIMEPIGLKYNGKKGYQIIHCCCSCNTVVSNRVAKLTVQEDDWSAVVSLSEL